MSDAIPSKAGVYRIYRIETGDEYVGSSQNLVRRWKYHVQRLGRGLHHARHLQNAWNKYGSDAFAFEILEIVEDISVLLEREDFYIQSRISVYNHRRIASSNLGVRWPDDARESNRQRVRAEWSGNEERRAKARALALRQWQDPEIRAKRLAAIHNRGPVSEETRAKIGKARRGRKASEETRAKQSAAHRGRKMGPCPPERREKIGAAQRGRPRGWEYTPESRAKLSASLKGKKKSPEHLARISASRAATRRAKMLQAGQQPLF